MNTHPLQTDPRIIQPPLNYETAYSQELAANIVEASKGTVGLFTAMNLERDERTTVQQTFAERNPGIQPDVRSDAFNDNNGWGNYGERMLTSKKGSEPLASVMEGVLKLQGRTTEELHFIDLPDGKVDVRYGFTSQEYRDYSGRGGNVMVMGFTVPKEGAQALFEAVQADPSYVRNIVGAQALALGLSESKWKQIAPRGEDPHTHVLKLVGHEPANGTEAYAETVSFDKHDPVVPVPEFEQPQPLSAESQPSSAYVAAQEEALEIMDILKDDFEGQLLNLVDAAESSASKALAAEIAGDPQGLRDAREAERAYRAAYREALQEMIVKDNGEAAFTYQDQLAHAYKTTALASGMSPEQQQNIEAVANSRSKSSAQERAYQLLVFNQALAEVTI